MNKYTGCNFKRRLKVSVTFGISNHAYNLASLPAPGSALTPETPRVGSSQTHLCVQLAVAS